MSYDIDIAGHSFNYTYNVSRLFHEHIPARGDDEPSGLQQLDGKTGKQAATILAEAFEAIDRSVMRAWDRDAVGEPVFCARYDAPNGWGSAVGALVFLANVMAACFANPRSRVRVW